MLRLCALLLAVLAPAAAARADLIEVEGRFGELDQPAAVATDSAGRVYVAEAGAARIAVFERARDGNRPLATFGTDRLVRPVGVAVDSRQRVYVADAERHVVEVFGSATEGFRHRGTLGEPGQAPGQLDAPRAVLLDPGLHAYVLERGNLRLTVFRPSGDGLPIFRSAFGLSQPEPLAAPSALARDGGGRFFVAARDGVRAVDRRGRFIATVGARFLKAPRGVAVDAFNRLVVADAERDRLEVFGPLREGSVHLGSFDGVRSPGPAAFAPGALLYVLEGRGVVRLSFDDGDRDHVVDRGDNCPAEANGDQANADDDPQGNACDPDDDGDGRPDVRDRCPLEPARGARDRDGCRNVTSAFLAPVDGRGYTRAPSQLIGRSEGGELGVDYVEVALARRLNRAPFTSPDARCAFLDPRARAWVQRPCAEPVWVRAAGQETWRLVLPPGLLAGGTYAALARANQRGSGKVERTLRPGRNVREFRVG